MVLQENTLHLWNVRMVFRSNGYRTLLELSGSAGDSGSRT